MSIGIVKTKYGLLSGTGIPGTGISVFKGVPFAKPPVGSLRWRAPEPPEAWEGVKKADTFAPAGMQAYPEKGSFYEKEWGNGDFDISEDCLYLNIWTPATSSGEKLPVAMWIFGGGYMNGFSFEKEFDGEALSRKGIVYVSIGYRLNAFGYLAHPDLSKEAGGPSGNYGVRDQIAALKWINENIEAFGGDPENVTVFGQSAGAGSTQVLSCSPLTKGLMHKAVFHSGSGLSRIINPRTKEQIMKVGIDFVNYCGYTSPLEMRDMPAYALLTRFGEFFGKYMMKNPPADPGQPELPFAPYVDGDVLHGDYEKCAQEGLHNDIHLMLGSTKDDMSTMSELLPRNIHEAAVKWAQRNSELGRKPNYVYFFDRELPGDDAGAFHSCDLWYVHGTLNRCWRDFKECDHRLSDTMTSYWTNFMKTGDPNGDGLPAWEPCTKESRKVMIFGEEIVMGRAEF